MAVSSKAAHWKRIKYSVGEHESFTSDDLQVCCVWVPLLRSFCFPVKHFMIPAIKEVTQILPQQKLALDHCCSTDFCPATSDFHR